MDTELKIILTSLKEMLKNKYGHDFLRLYIFGSQKDSFRPDSDCDVMIIFKKEKNWKEIKEIMDLVIDYTVILSTTLKHLLIGSAFPAPVTGPPTGPILEIQKDWEKTVGPKNPIAQLKLFMDILLQKILEKLYWEAAVERTQKD